MKARISALSVLIIIGLLILTPIANAKTCYFNTKTSFIPSVSTNNLQWNSFESKISGNKFFNPFYFFNKGYYNNTIHSQGELEEKPGLAEEDDQSWLPEKPETPDQPKQPEQPEQPEQPKQPDQPKQPEQDKIPDNNAGNNFANDEELRMIEYVNSERAKAGLSPLVLDRELGKVARIKSQDMVDNNYFSHTSPNYGSPFDMMAKYGISYRTAGENIAKNVSMVQAHNALMNSEGHRNNILNPNFTHIGIGIVKANPNGVMVTQMFIGK